MSVRQQMHAIKKNLKILAVQFKNNFVREAVYRSNFLTMMFVDLIWIVVEFSLFAVIYANTDSLGGWSQNQVYFFLGVFFASDALFTMVFQRNFWNFSDLVNKGELDILLTKPANPLLLALTRWMSLTAIFNVALGIAIMIKYAGPAGFAGGWHWFLVPVWLSIGVTASFLIRFMFSVWVFWTDRGFALSMLYYQFFSFASKPDLIYPPFIRYVLLTFLPFGFIGSVPARALLHGFSLWEWTKVLGVLLVFFLMSRFLWKRGLLRYQSASS